jgi:hypothetical protein
LAITDGEQQKKKKRKIFSGPILPYHGKSLGVAIDAESLDL